MPQRALLSAALVLLGCGRAETPAPQEPPAETGSQSPQAASTGEQKEHAAEQKEHAAEQKEHAAEQKEHAAEQKEYAAEQPATPTIKPSPKDGSAATTAQTRLSLPQRLAQGLKAKGANYLPRTRHKTADGMPLHTNRLIFEKSPYLLQHAHNPVNWFPWSKEAFEEARRADKPILMSVGYATCHWCHVMEEESFEDPEIAAYLNEHFVCIKVDREERPDVDAIYMDAVHLLHGRGGWPMTIVMTPEKKPFFGGTYFPPRAGVRGSRKGFFEILKELHTRYTGDKETLLSEAEALTRKLTSQAAAQPAPGIAQTQSLRATAERFISIADTTWGGFGRRPKFPRPATMELLLRYHRRSGDKRALEVVTRTLDKMADGGIHDHLAGGFHRYAVDNRWLIPHFEKMLYDNGQLAVLYLNAYQLTGRQRYADVARGILDYVNREMVDPGGAFWSATDADSEGEEGRFFIWSPTEIRATLPSDLAEVAIAWWGITERGNFEHKNILHTWRDQASVAAQLSLPVKTLMARVEAAREALYPQRLPREAPLTDDKVLAAWNGLMISGFARGAQVLGEPKYAEIAGRAADFVLTRMRRDGLLLRRYRQGEARLTAYLEDYAFLTQGLLDLFEATGHQPRLEQAIGLMDVLLRDYQDMSGGGFYRTAHSAEKLLVRDKPDYDGAQPAGNSIAAMNLIRLHEFTGQARYRTAAETTLRWGARRMSRQGPAVPAMMSALDAYADKFRQVVLVTRPDDQGAPLQKVIASTYLPNRVLVRTSEQRVAELSRVIPLVQQKVARDGRATAYVCEGGICQRPTSDPAVLTSQLTKVNPYTP